jgi:hypothetical protein
VQFWLVKLAKYKDIFFARVGRVGNVGGLEKKVYLRGDFEISTFFCQIFIIIDYDGSGHMVLVFLGL